MVHGSVADVVAPLTAAAATTATSAPGPQSKKRKVKVSVLVEYMENALTSEMLNNVLFL